MAAPRTAYIDSVLEAKSTDGITVQHWLGKLHTDKSAHLALFHLDEIIAAVDGSGASGYLGICNVGSPNYYKHAAARQGCIGSGAAGGIGIAFHDGGLNTIGTVTGLAVLTADIMNINIKANFKSAYYVISGNHGIEFYHDGAWHTWFDHGSLPQNTTANNKSHKGFSIGTIHAGTSVTVRAFIKNSEGTHYSEPANFYLYPGRLNLKYNDTHASVANSGSWVEEVYTGYYPFGIGTRFYPSYALDPTDPFPDGYYIFNGLWYEVRTVAYQRAEVVNFGVAAQGTYPTGDPGNAYPPAISIIGYKFMDNYEFPDLHNSCMAHPGGGAGTDKVYINPINSLVYENWNNLSDEYTELFTGYILLNETCHARKYVNGVWTDTITE